MPCMDTDLRGWLKSNPTAGPAGAKRIMYQVLRAVRCLHEAGIIHRDLKPENILVKAEGFHVKVIDFGLAREYASVVTNEARHKSLTKNVATLHYRAPEVLLDAKYSTPSELWILAMTSPSPCPMKSITPCS